MLGWDRTVGNMMEQSVPFLSLFWLNIYLSSFTELSCSHIMAAGWTYVALRSLYPVSVAAVAYFAAFFVHSWLFDVNPLRPIFVSQVLCNADLAPAIRVDVLW